MRDDHDRFTELGAKVVAVSAESPSAADSFLQKTPLPFPIVIDADHETFDAYDVVNRMMSLGQRPGLFVIDAEGVVRFDSIGTQQWQIPSDEQVLDVVRALRA